MKIRQLWLLESIKNLFKIDSPCYCVRSLFYSTQIRISLIVLLGMNDSVCHLGKLKLVDFKSFVICMSVPLTS